MLEIYDLKTEYRKDPIGIDVKKPAFSWKLRSDLNDVIQKGYRIQVKEGDRLVYDSDQLSEKQSLYHTYEGETLKPRTRYEVSVDVIDTHDETAHADAFFETGLMSVENFKADFITHGFEDDMEACALFSRTFKINKPIAKARIYASALGVYKLELNGNRVGTMRFAPGWTSYQDRLQYQTYDVTESLKEDNTIYATVANGWYKGILGFYGQGNHYGKRTAIFFQMEIDYEDGTNETICSDESWTSSTGPHRYSELYHGEVIDFSLDEFETRGVSVIDYPKQNLVSQISEPIRITQRLKVKHMFTAPNGEIILDFGQNASAVVEARLKQPKGTKVVLRHGEDLDENGNLFTENLRTAKATDTFICSGNEDVFLPEFTSHGFRYVSIEGLKEVDPDDFTACVQHTDFDRINSFSCDNPNVDQLWKNIDWTMRSNYFDIPMDCPQRDERLGYTGDTQIFLPTALFHGDLALFFRKWLYDLQSEQSDEFGVPLTVPDILRTRTCVSIWHDAATIVPWLIYQTYGDRRVLEEQFDSMVSCVEYSRRLAGKDGLLQIENSSQFGDWVAIDAPKGPYRPSPKGVFLHPSMDEKAGGTDSHLIGNAYYLYSLDILAKTAKILRKENEAHTYSELYQDVLKKFRDEYITANGRLLSETQTAAALVLYFDLAEEKDRTRILNKLILNLVKTQKHLRTGFVGTEYLPHVLSRFDQHQLVGDILMKDDCPSWLYAVKLGATTVWELWDGVNEDHSYNMFSMNSLNQYGFATIGNWLVKDLAGISSLEPGYVRSRIAPRLVSGITEVQASYETPYGKLSCRTACRNGRYQIDISIPANTEAVIELPGKEKMISGSGTYHFEYETTDSFEEKPYSQDSILNDILKDPVAKRYFEEKEPELSRNPMIRNFAGRLSISEIKMTLPKTMVPERAYQIFDDMIRLLNDGN